jgi:hypothetical protein
VLRTNLYHGISHQELQILPQRQLEKCLSRDETLTLSELYLDNFAKPFI